MTNLSLLKVDSTLASVLQALTNYGPLKASLHGEGWALYSGGIVNDAALCTGDGVTATIVLAGFGIEKETHDAYFLVKDSRGEKWGDKGYARISFKQAANCGLLDDVYLLMSE